MATCGLCLLDEVLTSGPLASECTRMSMEPKSAFTASAHSLTKFRKISNSRINNTYLGNEHNMTPYSKQNSLLATRNSKKYYRGVRSFVKKKDYYRKYSSFKLYAPAKRNDAFTPLFLRQRCCDTIPEIEG